MGYVETLLAANERIVVRTRQHWSVLARSFLSNLAIAIAIVLLTLIIAGLAPILIPLSLAFLLLLIFPIGFFVRNLLDWWSEEYLVTNMRVIQTEGLINKHTIDSSLEKVNDVVLTQSFVGRFLDYGDIEILTASEIGVNKLHKIASPVKFKTEMINQKEALGSDELMRPRIAHTGQAHDVPELIAELDELRKQGVLTEEEFQQKKSQLLAKM